MLALRHPMDEMHARFEGAHHACRGLVEHGVGRVIEEVALELEVDNEVHLGPVAYWRERPRVRQVLQRSPFHSVYPHLSRSIQLDLTRKAFLEWAEPDLEVGDDFLRILAVDTHAAAPGHE